MSLRRVLPVSLAFVLAVLVAAPPLPAQQVDPGFYSGMRWRLLGPFRGGRADDATGVPGQPEVFYFGSVGGGVWKTENAGRTWTPIFDDQPIGSIGAIAVAPSDPNVVYVGSGEADMRSQISHGNGMYKSTDAGRTWTRIGLEDSRQIGRIIVDPRHPEIVFVAALGHAYGPNAERGVFRSKDGGKTWQKVLFKDNDTGAIELAFESGNPQTIYAALWNTRRPPWNVYPPSYGPGSGLYKSTDGGDTWTQVTGHGFPSEGVGRIGVAVAPTDPNRVYAIVDAKEGGLYRSDDAGANWRRINAEQRLWGRGWYFCNVAVDPKDKDTVYVSNISLYRSRDAGQTFTSIKGAPGGDDYHTLWIYPDDPKRMIVATDQGVIVSVDGAQTWSSWYNQPIGQFYHVITDNNFPYWVYGAQQDSGAAGTTSRSEHRNISLRDWTPIGAGGENGYIATDPLNPDIVYGGTVTRLDRATGQQQNISPTLAHPGNYRRTWTLPLVFSPLNPRELYFSHQMLFRTRDAGQSWQIISPDLTREDPGVPPNLDAATAADNLGSDPRRGVIYSIAPSPLAASEIWVGTDDGLIHVTRDDGKNWKDVTPPELTPWSKVSMLVVSRHAPNTVYAAVDRHRLEDYRPHIYRTRDGGKTWQHLGNGIPDGSYLNAIREDPVRKGMLFAGTETGVFISFDDGDSWQPLQMNLPNVSVRDLDTHDSDLVIATHGRAFWVLDDITPLRQVNAQVLQADAFLFKPETAYRVRPGSDNGTPLPLDEPSAENPPTGAYLNYYLKSAPAGPVTLEILDAAGKRVRRYSSDDTVRQVNPQMLEYPAIWVRTSQPLSAAPGLHRFIWDLHYESTGAAGGGPGRRFGAGGPWALPGTYTVKLAVAGREYTQPLTVKMDPRVKTPLADLVKQFEMAQQIAAATEEASAASREAQRLRTQLQAAREKASGQASLVAAIEALAKKVTAIAGAAPATVPGNLGAELPSEDVSSIRFASGVLGRVSGAIQSADVAPSLDAVTAYQMARQALTKALAQWKELKSRDLVELNSQLQKAGLAPIAP